MESKPPLPPEKNESTTKPILFNLLLLLAATIKGGFRVIPITMAWLLIVNVVAMIFFGLFKGKVNYVLSFILSILVLFLIGFGECYLDAASF